MQAEGIAPAGVATMTELLAWPLRAFSTAEICGFGAGFAAYLLLIPPYGILGAAYGSLVGYGVCMVFAIVAAQVAGSRTATHVGGVPVPSDTRLPERSATRRHRR